MRVLIVEDEAFIAMEMADALTDAGCDIVGVAASVNRALAILDDKDCEVAVLDANLDGETTAPIADSLRARNIPFLVVSGYSCPDGLGGTGFLAKPYSVPAFVAAVRKLKNETGASSLQLVS